MLRRAELTDLLNLLRGRSESLFKVMESLESVDKNLSVETKNKFLFYLDNLACAIMSIELVLSNEGDRIAKVKREELAKNLLIVFRQDYNYLVELGKKINRESQALSEREGESLYEDTKKLSEEVNKLKAKYESHKIGLLDEYKYMNEIFIELKSEDHSFDTFRVELNNMANKVFTYVELA